MIAAEKVLFSSRRFLSRAVLPGPSLSRHLLTAAMLCCAFFLSHIALAADDNKPAMDGASALILEQLQAAGSGDPVNAGLQQAGEYSANAIRDALPADAYVRKRYGNAAAWLSGALRDTAAETVSGSTLQGVLNGVEPAAGDIGNRLMLNATGRAIDDAAQGARDTGLPFLRNLEAEYQLQQGEKPQYSLRAIDALYESPDLRHTVFAEGGVSYRGGRTTTNVGSGYRLMNDDETWLYGVNAFYDHEWEYKHHRVSLGVDATNTDLRVFANRYVALSGWRDARAGYEEVALSGWDAGISGPMPFLRDLEATGTAFTWQRHDSQDDLRGLRLNLDYTPTPKVALGLATTQDSDGDTQVAATIRYNFNAEKRERERNAQSVRDLRLKRVDRENTIVTQQRAKNAVATLGIVVDETTGANQVIAPDSTVSALSVGQQVQYDSRVVVSGGAGDYAQLRFGDGGILRIGSDTTVDIAVGVVTLVSGVAQYVSGSTNVVVNVPGGTIILTGTDIDVYSAGATSTVRVRDGQVSANGVTVNSGEIADVSGGAVVLAPGSPAYQQHRQQVYARLDNADPTPFVAAKAAPYVYRDVYVQSAPAQVGDDLVLGMAFSKAVTRVGPVMLDFTLNGVSRSAAYLSGDNSTTLLFRYVTVAADAGAGAVAIDDFTLNGGGVQSGAMQAVVYVPPSSASFPGGPVTPADLTVAVTSGAAPTTSSSPIAYTLTFSEAVTGLTAGDLAVSNGTASGLSTSDNVVWTVNVTPGSLGAVSVQVPAGAAQSAGGANNLASNTLSVTYDTGPPTGYAVAFTTDPIDAGNDTAAAFELSGAEVGTTYTYTITSSAGGAPVTGSASVNAATMSVTGIDVTALADGTLTLSLTLENTLGAGGVAVSDTVVKNTAPSGYAVAFTTDPVTAANASSAAFDLTSAQVGADYAYSITSSAGGTAVTGSGTVNAASMPLTGIDLSALPDGTLTLSLVLTNAFGSAGAAASDTVVKDTTPAGYAVAFVTDPVNAANVTAAAFDLTGAQTGASYAYSITSSGGGSAVTGSGTVTAATMPFTGLDLSGLGEGTLTLSLTLTSVSGTAGAAVTATVTKDTTIPAPSGYTVDFTTDPLTLGNVNAAAFDLAGAEVGATYNYSISSSGGGTPVTGSGTVTAASMSFTGIDLGGLADGTITASLTLSNPSIGPAVTDTTTKATTPSGYTATFTTTPLTAGNVTAAGFTLAGANVGDTYDYTITSSGGGTPVSASGTVSGASMNVTGIDLSGLADGLVTVSLTVTNALSETGAAATDTANKATVPTGYAVAFTTDPLTSANAAAAAFSITGATAGDSYDYTVSSSGGGASVTGSGIAAAATVNVTGVDLSAVPDGTLTVAVTLTNTLGVTGAAVVNTVAKSTTPTGYSVAFTTSPVNAASATVAAFDLSGAEVGTTYTYAITSSGGGAAVSGSGTVSTASMSFTALDVSGLGDGTLTVSMTLSSVSGSAGTAATATVAKDATAPAILSVTPPADGVYDDL